MSQEKLTDPFLLCRESALMRNLDMNDIIHLFSSKDAEKQQYDSPILKCVKKPFVQHVPTVHNIGRTFRNILCYIFLLLFVLIKENFV